MNNQVRYFRFSLTNYWPHVLLSILLLILVSQVWEQNPLFRTMDLFGGKENKDLYNLLDQIDSVEKYNPDLALLLSQKVIERARILEDEQAMGQAYYWSSTIELLKSRHAAESVLSLTNAKISKDLLLKGKDNFWKANIIELLGSIYYYQMDTYPEEVEDSVLFYTHLLDSIQATLPANSYESTYIHAKLNILKAAVWEKLDLKHDAKLNPDTSQKIILLLSRSLEDFQSINHEEGIGICLRNLANTYTTMKDFDQAETLYKDAISSNERLGSELAKHNSLQRLGEFYYFRFVEKGEKELMRESLNSYKSVLEIPKFDHAEAFCGIAKVFHQEALIASQKNAPNLAILLDSADKYYLKAFEAAKDENNIYILEEIIENYSKMCEHLTKPSCATFLKKVKNISPLLVSKVKGITQDAEATYQQFRRNTLEKEKNREQKNTVIIALAVLSFLVSIFILFYSELKHRLERQQLKARLKALQAQMNPHFISNSLSAIKSLIGKKENKLAANYLVDFSRLARTVLDHCQKSKINIREEIEMLELYLSLEKLRMDQKLEYSIQVDDSLDKEKTFIPPMFIQPFAENAIWHGLKHKEGNASLSIQFFRDGSGILVCSVEDNGIGRAKSAELQSESDFQHVSYSTMITKSRVDLLKSEVGHNLQIIDLTDKTGAASGTRVEIFFHQTNKN